VVFMCLIFTKNYKRKKLSIFFYKGLFFFFFLQLLRFEPRAYTLSHSTSPFMWWIFFKIGSHDLFAQVIFKPQSSDLFLLRVRIIGVSH
jgi:hypothetical protein